MGGGREPASAKVKATGRLGTVVVYDPDDSYLSYKLKFSDGEAPEVEWYAQVDVELLDSSDGLQEVPRFVGRAGSSEAAPSGPDRAELKEWAETARVKCTPVQDEAFICMGSKAPRCPRPKRASKAAGPITLETLQGEWVGSGGVQIAVIGTDVFMNNLALKGHKVTLRDDGTVSSIGTLWQLDRWDSNGGIEFRCSSTRENMECAKVEVWSRRDGGASGWYEKMKLLGYAGSSADPLGRGIEGCMPGTSGAEMPEGYAKSKDAEDVALLSALVSQWREPETVKVRPMQVVPDFTNRAQTGLGVELVHFVAHSMKQKGFKKRKGNEGHDIPVLVREPPGSDFHAEALQVWRDRVGEEDGFPPVRANDDEELFTSLGNGHFFQALNLYDCECTAINKSGTRYTIDGDAALSEAVRDGVTSIVLRHQCPRAVRAKIADLLNKKRDFFWTLGEDGKVDVSSMKENTEYCSQFEWLSKGMDAEQVNCLVRTHLGIRDSKRIQG